MKFLSVCSGIEAASVAWAPLGWKAWAFSEIEPFPCSLLAHHYPDTPNFGDMTKFQDWPIPDEPIDLLCGGTPCQSFSVAGLRKGLADPRGNLMLTYLAIADKYRPKWLVWENVPGVLSSNGGRDFGAFLGGLGQLGYGFAYRVLDAQFFGVAQRRRRVFVVGHLGDWRRAAAVLFERHSLQGHPAPRREAGQGFASSTAPSLTASGRGVERCGESRGQDPVVAVPAIVGQAMSAKWAKGTAGPAGPAGDEHHNLIAVPDITHALRGEGFDASEDGAGRGTPLVPIAYRTAGDGPVFEEGSATAPLTTNTDPSANIIAFSAKDYGHDAMSNLAPTLRAGGHADSHANAGVMPAICLPINDAATRHAGTDGSGNQAGRGHGLGIGAAGDPMYTLTKGDKHAIAIQGAATRENPASGPDGIGVRTDNAAYTLEARSEVQAVQTGMQVRRLTPRECERLQGFPDDYTLIPHGRRIKPEKLDRDFLKYQLRGNPKHLTRDDIDRLAADGPRYKALGNSWAVPCARWIGERIAAVDTIPTQATKEAA